MKARMMIAMALRRLADFVSPAKPADAETIMLDVVTSGEATYWQEIGMVRGSTVHDLVTVTLACATLNAWSKFAHAGDTELGQQTYMVETHVWMRMKPTDASEYVGPTFDAEEMMAMFRSVRGRHLKEV